MIGFLILLLIFITLFVLFLQDNNSRIAFVKTILSFTLFQLILTEILSILNKIDFYSYIITYLCFLIILIFILYKKRNLKLLDNYQIIRFILRVPKIYKIIFGFLFINVAIIILASLFYPPNNADVNTCWLARIEHWISNKTLSYYPTQNNLQNIHQPLSSIIFLNIRILTKANLFLNLTQLIFLVSISFILIEIIKKEFKHIKFQIVNLIIVFSIPLIILQASSSKNDLIVSFFFISSCYFLIKIIEDTNFFNIFWFSISIALGILTKFSIVPFLFVFITYYLFKLLIINYRKAILVFLTSLVIVIFLSTPYFIRNYNYCGDILGRNVQVNSRDFQTEMSGTSQSNIYKRSISVIAKYVGYALSNPITKTNSMIEKFVNKLDRFLNLNEQDVLHFEYTIESANVYNEDCKNNFLIFILILLSIPFAFIQNKLFLKEFLILSIISILLFCFIFPIYDIARGRYMIPLVLLLTIQLTYYIVIKFNKPFLVIFLVFSMINTLFVSYKNWRTFLPINEIIQYYKFHTKHIPSHFTSIKDFYSFLNDANNEEGKL